MPISRGVNKTSNADQLAAELVVEAMQDRAPSTSGGTPTVEDVSNVGLRPNQSSEPNHIDCCAGQTETVGDPLRTSAKLIWLGGFTVHRLRQPEHIPLDVCEMQV